MLVASRKSTAEEAAPCAATRRSPGSTRSSTSYASSSFAAPDHQKMWKASIGSVKPGSIGVTSAPCSARISTAARPSASTSESLLTKPRFGEKAILSPATPSSRPSRKDRVGVGIADQSRASYPVMRSSMAAASRTDRVIGPTCDKVPKALGGYSGTRPYVGLSATVPVKAAGIRTDPPPSVPTDQAPMPSATAAADPPLEPPGVVARSQGLRVTLYLNESVTPFQENSGVVVLPRMTAPASRSRATDGASSSHGPASSINVLPRSVGQPRVHNASLIDVGTPSAGPSGCPACHRASDSFAAASAPSASTRTKAFTWSSYRSIASSAVWVASTGDSSFRRYASTRSTAIITATPRGY